MPNPIEITLIVTKFTENPSNTHPARDKPEENCTIADQITMNGDITGLWQHDPLRQVFICPKPDVGVIAVKGDGSAPVEFSFKINSGNGVPALRPTAIVFEQQKFKLEPNRTLDDTDGAINFPFETRGAKDGKLTIVDRWVSRGKSKNRDEHHAPHWKFWIRVETTDPNSTTLRGWIDPIIENSEDMEP